MQLKEIMRCDVEVVRPHATLAEAAALIRPPSSLQICASSAASLHRAA